jgi:hypothetical protein
MPSESPSNVAARSLRNVGICRVPLLMRRLRGGSFCALVSVREHHLDHDLPGFVPARQRRIECSNNSVSLATLAAIRAARHGSAERRNKSGSFAILVAMRPASSRVSNWPRVAIEQRPGTASRR